MGEFWFPPLIAIIALLAFYLEGRGRIRSLFHFLLISWHIAISGIGIYGVLQSDTSISFGTWGISFSIGWLLFPFFLFLILAIILVIQEIRNPQIIPVYSWKQVNKKLLGIAVLLLPIAFLFFQSGHGFDIMVKIAVAVTIVQWIFLVEALGRPSMNENADSKTQVSFSPFGD